MLRQEALLTDLPFELVPTRMPGVYTSPPLPDDFDPNTASPVALIKHGLLWRRPQPGDHPALAAAWKRAFSRRWLAADRVVPELEPQHGRIHLPRGVRRTETGYTSHNWGGGVVSGPGQWTTAVGSWTIPTVTQPAEPQGQEGGWNSSSWVGIDGSFGSNDVLQAGIEQRVDGAGNASYVAWFEWFAPAQQGSPSYIYQTNIPNFPVSPGQEIYCSVQYINNKAAGHLYLANNTTGQYASFTLAPPPGASFSGNCVEWIMEAPDGGEPVAALPAFTPVVFSGALGCSVTSVADPKNGDYFNITNGTQVLTSAELAEASVTISFIG